MDRISGLADWAPLHNPPALEAIRAAKAILPLAAQVAVFDTAFYAQLPPKAHVYPAPYEWYTEWGVRRFGFHGISQTYCTQRAAEMLGGDVAEVRSPARILVIHTREELMIAREARHAIIDGAT